MTRLLLLVCLLTVPMIAFPQRLSHSLNADGVDARKLPAPVQAVPETVKVLAVRVQFLQDKETRTTGDGTFQLTAGPADTVLDAPPHDAEYFRDHLRFLENYYRRVSKGKVVIESTLLDSIVTLPSLLQAYSPPRGSSNVLVADLARDTWHLVDSLKLVQDFRSYQSFVVFHAGSGRDIDLIAELGYDPTPYDIPSLYFGLGAFRSFYGAAYAGIPVQGGTFFITNTMVLPETESRLLPGAVGDFPLVLGINGLLCASMGNYLGLPDLFDTKTGASGIGRFGLMDGQAIFSFSGAFPPEPSAWEKYWLGWINPITVNAETSSLRLPAVTLADSVYRIPISSEEYFLLENRSRDPFRTGVTLTTVFRGVTRQQTFTRDVDAFNEFDVSALSGNVTDVSVPDWSLPGATDPDGTFYDGGVVIWHIDESVIAQGIDNDVVNADPEHRGVSVMEADGSQDIGRSYGMFTGGSGSEQGTPLDFWFTGNIAPIYKNEFSPTTLPSSKSNTGANTHITVRDFSQRSPEMTLTVERGDAQISPLPGFPKLIGQVLSPRSLVATVSASGVPSVIVSATGQPGPKSRNSQNPVQEPGRVFAWSVDGSPALAGGASSGLVTELPAGDDVATGPIAGPLGSTSGGRFFIPVNSLLPGHTGVRMFSSGQTAGADSLAVQNFFLPLPRSIVCPPAANDSIVAVGVTGGMVYFVRFDGTLADSLRPSTDSLAGIEGISRLPDPLGFLITTSDGTVVLSNAVLLAGKLNSSASTGAVGFNFGHSIAGPAVSMGAGTASDPVRIAFVTKDGYLFLTDITLRTIPGFPISVGGPIPAPPAFADMNGDGVRDIVVFSGGRVCVYNTVGASLDYFPVTLSASSPITSAPVVADVDGDGLPEIVAVTADGVVGAFSAKGKMLSGFPLAAGRGNQDVAVSSLTNSNPPQGIALFVGSSDNGGMHGWKTYQGNQTAANPWPQYQYDPLHSGNVTVSLPPGVPVSAEFMPQDRVYNWPNPVYDGKTFIRYFISEDATIHIKIFDLAGDLVTELSGPGNGGIDNEVAWNVTGVQSGVYLARVEADAGGKSEIRIIKIAVVR
ncbi:MAG: FG-GAP-like repeat-containing protein [Bacteroidota bacterium]